MTDVEVSTTASGVRFAVRVQPRASRNEVVGTYGPALRVRLLAAPVNGAANAALILFLSDSLGVARRLIRIVSGASSRSKIVEVDGVTPQQIHELIRPPGYQEVTTKNQW